MKKHSESLERTTRRDFAKAAVASLLALPLASELAAQKRGKTPSSKDTYKQNSTKVDKPTIMPCEPSGLTSPHEPPIGLTDGGSLLIHVPKSNKIPAAGHVAGDDRPFKHILGTAQYTGIQEVKVLKRMMNGPVDFTRYILPVPDLKYQLRIWLVQLKTVSGSEEDEYDPIQAGAKPHLLLKPASPQIETQHPLQDVGANPKFSHMKPVPFRYEYPPHGRHFHIGQWQITEADGKIVKDAFGKRFEGRDDASYELFVSFYHL